ncbi:MAG TPA: DNA polymerase III subunit alpha, partial [Bryobacterales bacterium]|nr:DNA polymerase III subunit alpha [Bryobacterales bacterium]
MPQGRDPGGVLRDAPEEEVRGLIEEYAALFGEGNFFLEVQEAGLEEQSLVREALLDWGRRLGIGVVATNDCHYLAPEDAAVQDVLMCLQTGTTLEDPERMRLGGDGFWFCPSEEMARRFAQCPGEVLSLSVEIAERCDVELPMGRVRLPEWPDAESVLRERAREGLIRRLRVRAYRDEGHKRVVWRSYRRRLDEELGIIVAMGFAGYFLIVSDFVGWAKAQGIPVGPGRGSAAGSLVAYALGITDVDPIPYGLLFERFLNPERVSLPDIDVDFCPEHRGRVLEYVAQRYGKANVAQITTVGRLVGRGAVRDVGRVMGLPLRFVDEVAREIPEEPGTTVAKALERNPALRESAERDPAVRRLLDLARRLEGVGRHASIHAAGVVIGTESLDGWVPLYVGKDGETVTHYDMAELEALGFVKFDFLGLRTLTVIARAERYVRERVPGFSVEAAPLDDPEVYAMLSRGETGGVFQLESRGMRDLLRRLQPERFEDLIAVNALYRPGPLNAGLVDRYVERRHGREPVEYPLPQLEPILRETYGVLIYQEQVMRLAQEVAGYSLGEADLLRRAMGKKKPEEMAAHRERFVSGAVERGVEPEVAESLFDQMAGFAEYGFNKSHAAAYALLAYRTAYLRKHHPQAFFAALLSAECGDADKVAGYVEDARRMGVRVLPPDVNASDVDFLIEGEAVRFGLRAVRHVGAAAAEAIVAVRREGGPFRSVEDFLRRAAPRREVTRRVVESLVDAGAFDGLDADRGRLREGLESLWAQALSEARR